jgi:hypothetical protein
MTKAQKRVALSRNPRLWLLKHEVDDDRFLQIIGDFAGLIRRSERACKKAAAQDNPDYAQFVADSESDYLEEIVGASFLVLQAKIRRVDQAVKRLVAFMHEQYGLSVSGLDHRSIFALNGNFRGTSHSLIELIWTVGNYYKHRDEWDAKVWKDEPAKTQGHDPLRRYRGTRRIVKKSGSSSTRPAICGALTNSSASIPIRNARLLLSRYRTGQRRFTGSRKCNAASQG